MTTDSLFKKLTLGLLIGTFISQPWLSQQVTVLAQTTSAPVQLKADSLVLVNAAGVAKTVFQPNEPIYIKATLSNRGTAIGVSGITTQLYAHAPNPVAAGSIDSPEFSLLHGAFHPTPANNPNLYQSTPNHWSLNRFATPVRYFTQKNPGTYTARIFIDAKRIESRDNPVDNQLTATYTIAGVVPTPTATPKPTPTPTPTSKPATIPNPVNSSINMVVDAFQLTNSAGQIKTTFAPGEAIYVRSVLRNTGSKYSNNSSQTQYFAHQPNTVAVGSKNNPEISTTHAAFTAVNGSGTYTYESRPNGSRSAQFNKGRFFSQSTPGTYTARVFVDANNSFGETNEADNQRSITYTIVGPTPTPTATPKPTPTPTPTSTPKPTSTPVATPKPTATPVPAGYNQVKLRPESLVLVNSAGQAKTTFAPNERIYVQLTIGNRGTHSGVSGIKTQIYAHRPQPVAVGAVENPEFSLLHGAFAVTPSNTTNWYQSTPNHWSLNRFATPTRYFSQSTPGTYTARVFVNYNGLEKRDDLSDNQLTATYTINGPSSTPTPTPKPTNTPTPTPNPTPVPTPVIIPSTVNSAINLVVESFNLTDARGNYKTTFTAGEAIYVRSSIRNTGTKYSSAASRTQYFAHQPNPVSVGSKNSPEISTGHGAFTPTSASNPFIYESRPNGTRVNQFTSTRYFTQNTPGTYTARVFTDATNAIGETNETDNQRTITYTVVAAPKPTPTPTPGTTPTPWPSNTKWPQPVQNHTSILAIVNKKFKLPSTYVPTGLRSVNMPLINNQPLRQEAATALEKMHQDALKQGIRMHLRSGYRSYATQDWLYWDYVNRYGRASADTFSARPGHSEHQTGLAFDLGDRDNPGCDLAECFANTKSGRFVASNSHKYGFVIRYPKGKDSITGYKYEPWHLRYFGVDLATRIYNSGLTTEQYLGIPGGGY